MDKFLEFWNTVLEAYNTEQSWSIDQKTVLEKESIVLRQFNTGDEEATPILIIPPNAGHHSNICEKLIITCLENTPNKSTFAIEWLNATRSSAGYSIEDMATDVRECVKTLGNEVHLFCLCQGAWLGAIYASLFPESVASYTNAAGPIDFAAGNGKIKSYCRLLPFSFFQNLVKMGSGTQLGNNQVIGFKNLNPYERWFKDYMDLWMNMLTGNTSGVNKWKQFKQWYEFTLDLDGKWFLQAVELLFKGNKLVNGELVIMDRIVDLAQISCPVYLMAGGMDDITPEEQVFNMAQHVSGPSQKILIQDAGHIGVFVKDKSLEYWKAILNELVSLEQGIKAKNVTDVTPEHYQLNPDLLFDTWY